MPYNAFAGPGLAILLVLLVMVGFPLLLAIGPGLLALFFALLAKFVFGHKPASFFGLKVDFAKLRDYSFEAFTLLLSTALLTVFLVFLTVKLLLPGGGQLFPWIILIAAEWAIAISLKLAVSVKFNRSGIDFSEVPGWIKYLLKLMVVAPAVTTLGILLFLLSGKILSYLHHPICWYGLCWGAG